MDQLIVLGTGAAIITKYYNTCFLLDSGDELFLVDGGGGGLMRQMELAGADWNKLHHIFLSHSHTDHILGMVWAVRNIGYQMILGRYQGEVNIYGCQAVLDDLQAICRITLSESIPGFFGRRIHFVPVQNGERRNVLHYELTFFDTLSGRHPQYAFAARLPGGGRLAFCGDEPLQAQNRPYAEGCDWMLAEAYCLERDRDIYLHKGMSHNTVKETARLAQGLGARNLVLWHTEDGTFGERRGLYTEEGRQYYAGNLLVPEDLDRIELG